MHGFPESWWAFHKVIPLLADTHQVFAVDLRGFGDSATAPEGFDGAIAAEDLHLLIQTLGAGPFTWPLRTSLAAPPSVSPPRTRKTY
ncbi:alpha/beta fold hydrolase [Oerskovia sp. M15]